jgi:hypothetical protein
VQGLSVAFFEAPLPLVALVGLYLLLARRLHPGAAIVAVWALVPLVANAFYWHHGWLMGPRMLHDAAPAWALLFVLAAAWALGRLPAELLLGDRRLAPRAAAATFLLAGGLVGLLLAPQRAFSHRPDILPEVRRLAAEAPPRSVVFVHGSWAGRLSMSLAAAGMRLDSVETALRQNTTCEVQRFLEPYRAHRAGRGGEPLPALEFGAPSGRLLVDVAAGHGNRIRTRPGEVPDAECVRQARADAGGIMDVANFLWLGDLPGRAGEGALFVRDLGPVENRTMLARYPERSPYVLHYGADGSPRLQDYGAGMATLWSGARSPEEP